MKFSWANSGVDLLVDVPPGAGRRGIRRQLEAELREAVRTGRLAAGTRLPPSRSLAHDLEVARNTVADTYAQLVAEGWLTARQGAGTYVADRLPPITVVPGDASDAIDPSPRLSLAPGSPDVSAFPRTAWLASYRRALAAAPRSALGYGDPRGRLELRVALTHYLARVRGVRTSPNRIVVCSGAVQALALLGAAVRASGGTSVAVEEAGLALHRAVLGSTGLQARTAPVDERGIRVDLLGRADAALLTPAHQFPMGVALAPERRAGVVEWATRRDAVIVEDDYDGEFRYDRQPVGALQALDPEHVVYVGTASKSLVPALRLAWMVLPSAWVESIAERKGLADIQGGVLEQLALADFIQTGAYDRQVRRARLRYRRRRDRLVLALARHAPDVTVSGIAAGLHALVWLPRGLTADEVTESAHDFGLAVSALAEYRAPTAGTTPDALVVGYGTPADHEFGPALDALCRTFAHCG